ncbi:uncharacterized protein LOC144474819 isoform X2 [Augochlora pura]
MDYYLWITTSGLQHLQLNSHCKSSTTETMDTIDETEQDEADMYIHSDVLQRVVRQIRDPANVRLLSELGARLGISEKRDSGRDQALRRGHHQPARG